MERGELGGTKVYEKGRKWFDQGCQLPKIIELD